MESNIPYGNVEFVLLDYNSQDGLEDWVRSHCTEHLDAGYLQYCRTTEPACFKRSHSRNMAFRLASGDILVNVDADNFIGAGFADFIAQVFTKHANMYLTPEYVIRDVMGRLAVKQEDFYAVNGYNEHMEGYGFEDLELYNRLSKTRQQLFFSDKKYLQAIHHSNQERFANEYIGQQMDKMYITYLNPYTSELLFLYKDGRYETGTLQDNEDLDIRNEKDTKGNLVSLLGEWQTGSWQRQQCFLTLQGSDTRQLVYTEEDDHIVLSDMERSLKCYEVFHENLRTDILLLRTEMDNRDKMYASLRSAANTIINPNGFGQGTVYKNFSHAINLQ